MTTPLHELGLASDVLVWEAALLTAMSLAVGILGGFVGLALGSMRLPVLLLLGFSPTLAAGTNIIVSAASAATGSVRHLREGRVDRRLVLTMGAPSIAGGFVGGFYAHRAPETFLLSIVGVLLFWQGVEFVVRSRDSWSPPGERQESGTGLAAILRRRRTLTESVSALVIGLLGGAVGLILGGTRLPVLIRVLRVDPRIAAGSSMFIGFMLGGMGFVAHAFRGNVDYPMVVLMGSTAMVGSYIGARFTGRVSRANLVTTMGFVLVVMGSAMVWRAFNT